MLILLLLVGVSLWAQDIGRKLCTSEWPSLTTSRVAMYVPARVTINDKTIVYTYPICADLGSGLKLEVANGRWVLSAAVIPRMVFEKLAIAPGAVVNNVFNYTLKNKPAIGTLMLVFYSTVRIGMDVNDVVTPDYNSKQLVVSVPLSVLDVNSLTIVYWTNDPP
jgi:hypothetical protein